jgi:hypothetical protein
VQQDPPGAQPPKPPKPPTPTHPPAHNGEAIAFQVGVADTTQREAVTALRRAAYRGATQFDWNDESTLDWSTADDTGTVLAVWDTAGSLLSTIRASVFADASAAEAFLEYSLAGINVPGPALVLSRAATAPAAAHHGLFALLRYAYLSALPATPVSSVIAIVYEGAPHSGFMRECGYSFFEPQAAWDSEAVARARPLLAVLPRMQFAHSLSMRRAALLGHLDSVQFDVAAIAQSLRLGCAALEPSAPAHR